MRTDTEPHLLCPDQRLAEIASLLARGLRSLRDRHALSPDATTTSAENSPLNSLDVSAAKSVTVTRVNTNARKEIRQ